MNKAIILGINMMLGLALISFSSWGGIPNDIEISITGLKSEKGQVVIQVFKDEQGYEDQKPFKKLIFDKKGFEHGAIKVTVKLAPGNYAFTMIDDENLNGKIDKNFIGVPKEGFGFSNFLMEKMQKPKFGEFVVNLMRAGNITMKVKYM